MTMQIYAVPNVPGKKKFPVWARSAIIDDASGAVFVPALIGDLSDMAAMLCAGYDGTPIVAHDNHVFVPAEWMKKEKPDTAELIDKIVANLTRAIKTE